MASQPLAVTVCPEMLDAIVDPVLLLSADWTVAHVNAAGAHLLGQPSIDALLGRDIWEAFPDAVGSTFQREYEEVRRTRAARVFTEYYAGLETWFEIRAYPAGERLLILFRDVGDVVARERHLADLVDEHDRLRRVATAVAAAGEHDVFDVLAAEAAGLAEADIAAVARFDAGRSYQLVGLHGEAPLLAPARDVPVSVLPGSAIAEAYETGRPVVLPDLQRTPLGGRMQRSGIRGLVIVPVVVDGRLWGTLSVAARATWPEARRLADRLARFAELAGLAVARVEAHARLARQARIDAHTGLLNSSAFAAALEEQVRTSRSTGEAFCLAVFDIDHFKSINDGYGHAVGDEVLRHVAGVLQRRLRDRDVIGRVGGDELAVLVRSADAPVALALVERARQAISVAADTAAVPVTASAGIASWTLDADAQVLFRRADDALYWAKANGRDAAWIYDPSVVKTLTPDARRELVDRGHALAGLRALARAIDAKDSSTRRHSQRVAALARELALDLGWSPGRADLLHEAGLVHDVGKIGVPDAVLLKPGRLDAGEYEAVKRHAALGAEIVEGMLSSEQVLWVRHHHERPDGAGYPDGLTDEAISEGAAILAVADTWDVMTSARSYSPPKPVGAALLECRRLAGRQFRRAAVEALTRVVGAQHDAA